MTKVDVVINKGATGQAILLKAGTLTVPAGQTVKVDPKNPLKLTAEQKAAFKEKKVFFTKADADAATEAEQKAMEMAKAASEEVSDANRLKDEAEKTMADAKEVMKAAEEKEAETATLAKQAAEDKAEAEKLLAEATAAKASTNAK